MTEVAFLLLVFVLSPVLTIALIMNMVLMRRRDPSPPGGWTMPPAAPAAQAPMQPMQVTVLAGWGCACGGQLQVTAIDQGSRQPAAVRCQACGMESTLGPWTVLRERAWPPV